MSAITLSPVLPGFVPGVTATESTTGAPASTDDGVAEPKPVGFVDAAQPNAGADALRGAGAPAVKSAELSSVSVHPLPLRRTAVVFDGAGAGLAPSKKFAPP
jgi:hypothetical protein